MMKKGYLVAGAVFVVLVVAAIAWASTDMQCLMDCMKYYGYGYCKRLCSY
jgi:hypothetical protein